MFGTGITRLISNTFQQAGLLAGGREVGEVEIADADEQPIPPAARTEASRPPVRLISRAITLLPITWIMSYSLCLSISRLI